MGRGRSLGITWIWRAFAPEFCFRLASLVANHNSYNARPLLRKIQGRLKGALRLFVSDSLKHYVGALLEVFCQWKKPQPTGLLGRPCRCNRVPSPDLRYAQVQFFESHGFSLSNPFSIALQRGQSIHPVSMERSESEDDDWITFKLKGPDPRYLTARGPN